MNRFALVALLAAATLSAAHPAAASAPTLFAEESITISGSDNGFCGVAHSNGDVKVTGSDNLVSGPFEYVGSFHGNHNNAVTPTQAARAPMPTPAHDLAYYRALAQASGTYFSGDATLPATPSGLVFAEGDIRFNGNGVTASVTFVSARGMVSLGGPRNALRPAIDALLFFAAAGDADITGSHSTYDGGLYAPAGAFARHGTDDSNVLGPVVARTISWSGSRNHLGGECCAEASDCRPATACDIATCGTGTCTYTSLDGCIPCAADADCNDQSSCTTDTCQAGRCTFAPVTDGAACGDSTVCNGAETCRGGTCTAGTALDCNDQNACTTDACDPVTGCTHTPVTCDDQNAGTLDACLPASGCTHTPVDCDDRNPCTTDTRDPVTGCVHTNVADGTACGDSNTCNGAETCRAGTCTAGTPLDCNDQNACTTDACDPVTGCTHTAVTCDDQNAGTLDACLPTSGCTHTPIDCDDRNPCTTDTRDPVTGCVHTNVPDGAVCGDATVCNGIETCQVGTCTAGAAPNCDDQNACTTDSCAPVTGCQHTPIDDCRTCTTTADCNDSDGCTADSCDGGACRFTETPGCVRCTTAADCPPPDSCTAALCLAEGACTTEPKPACGACQTASDCDDQNACTTDECTAGSCMRTEAPSCTPCATDQDCNDQDTCTADTCAAGKCSTATLDPCPGPTPPPSEACGDCQDNDGDGLIDLDDPDCCPVTMPLTLQRVKLAPDAKRGDKLVLVSSYTPAPGFDPLAQDTSLQIMDHDGQIFCADIASDHWMPMGKRAITFWDRKGAYANGLSDGRFKNMGNGNVLFRTHGRRVTLRSPMNDRVRITVRVGAQCAQANTSLRPTKTGLALP